MRVIYIDGKSRRHHAGASPAIVNSHEALKGCRRPEDRDAGHAGRRSCPTHKIHH